MPRYYATYDLQETTPDPHGAFIEEAAECGWSTWIQNTNSEWFKLPNTTVVGDFDTMDKAIAAFKAIWAAVKKRGIILNVEKWLVVQSSASRFSSDERSK